MMEAYEYYEGGGVRWKDYGIGGWEGRVWRRWKAEHVGRGGGAFEDDGGSLRGPRVERRGRMGMGLGQRTGGVRREQ